MARKERTENVGLRYVHTATDIRHCFASSFFTQRPNPNSLTMSRFLLVSSAVAATVATAANIHDRKFYEEKFYEWLQEFKSHPSVQVRDGDHFVHLLQNFANNHDLIETHNAQNLTYTLGHNAFSHMSYEEWVEYMRFGLAKDRVHEPSDLIHEAPEDPSVLASSVDWVAAGAVTPVKNQGNCGSCWSFSATGSLEGVYKIKTGTLNSYSEQELVSCDIGTFTNHGCNGGLMDYAFKWVKDNGGLCYESAYPYTSGTTGQNGDCKSHTCDDKSLKLTGYVDVKTNNDAALASAVAMNPTAIAIQANQPAFQLYKSGVLTGTCGANLDHGVLAVGYGTDSNGGDYWKVKNSWGASWGESGYIRIARGESYNNGKGQCGIYSGPPSYPTM
jgi:C1A family cysteine protease